jgi:hypothetical protein
MLCQTSGFGWFMAITPPSRRKPLGFIGIRQAVKLCRLFFRHAVTLWFPWRSVRLLNFTDYSSVTLNPLPRQQLQRADCSTDVRKLLRSLQLRPLGRFRHSGLCVRVFFARSDRVVLMCSRVGRGLSGCGNYYVMRWRGNCGPGGAG